ncbi:DNA-binding MarR family transcriptional regulator [Paenibacillus castaneae]|uniref:MarR family winged helix-turn-helix transcriptional regulator n=1 Tax=Paenibacillus castaneae TaxID=474957 RepID=UPI000C9AAB47|nr:MarR family transcriptional regulator [Paenibacillus castaneae]NIK77090.1 DNA-binding MarR family transcriptional regulator [Paenibacillus castaneae]
MSTSKKTGPESFPPAGIVLETLIRTTHRLHLQFEMHLNSLDIPAYLTGPRLRFLVAISEAGKIRMSELATKLGIKPRTVTQFVDALEQENLLVRIPDPDDRRATFLQLSDIAPPIIIKARAAMSESAENVLTSLSAERRVQLLNILNQISVEKEIIE